MSCSVIPFRITILQLFHDFSFHCCDTNACFVSDNSGFAEVQKQVDGGFHMFNQFTVFAYSQLQNILPDSVIGNISNWNGFLNLNLDSSTLPYKSPDDFVLNEYFHRLVLASKLPRPSKFVEQSIGFCKAFRRQ